MIGIVFQSFNLISTMTALENVEAPMYIHPNRREARNLSVDMLRQVGLSDRLHHLPHQLSGGEQQRVAIARALVTRPQVLLADEPTGNLDSSTSKQVLQIIEEMRNRLKLTIIMVTHDASIAARADRCLHIMDGKLARPEPVQPPPLYFRKVAA
jgi:putative ABC transport system ATP-binding protein